MSLDELPFAILETIKNPKDKSYTTLAQALDPPSNAEVLYAYFQISDEVLIERLTAPLSLQQSSSCMAFLLYYYQEKHGMNYLVWLKIVLKTTPYCSAHSGMIKLIPKFFPELNTLQKNFPVLMMIKGKLEVLKNIIDYQKDDKMWIEDEIQIEQE